MPELMNYNKIRDEDIRLGEAENLLKLNEEAKAWKLQVSAF
jgi:hypothetical protein